MNNSTKEYLKELKRRGKESHVYRKYQLVGLEIAKILGDEAHKALYIKLVKERGECLLELAKQIAEKKNVKNKGAYFMSLLPRPPKPATSPEKKKHGRKNSRHRK